MVQIPTYQAQQGLDAPSYPTPSLDNSIGEGLGAVGSALSSAGNTLGGIAEYQQRKARQKADFSAAIGYDKLNAELDQDLTEAERNAPADGSGLYEGFTAKSVNPKTQAFLSSISDPEIRTEYEQRLEVLREKWGNEGVNREYDLSNKHSVTTVGELGDARTRGIAENPAAVSDYVREMDDIIDKAPNLTAAQREAMKTKFRQNAPAIVAESLKQTDPEALYFASGNGSNDERVAFLTQRVMPAFTGLEVTPDQVEIAIQKAGGDVEEATTALAKELKLNKQETQALVSTAMKTLGNGRLASGKAMDTPTGAPASAMQFIAGFEGFRNSTYWDVNHHRVGYGSDTITRADGTVVTVKKGMVVSREDAARDLERRIGDIRQDMAASGGRGWASLPDGARNAVISVVYNYGRLPDAVAAAVKSGDKTKVSAAILSLANHNGGVNAKRRRAEAMAALHGTAITSATPTEGSPVAEAGAPRSGFVSDVFAEMPTPELINVQSSAGAMRVKAADTAKQELEVATTQAEQTIAEDVASLEQSGKSTIATADFAEQSQQIFTLVGPEKYAKWLDDRTVAQRTHEYTSDMDGLTEAALAERLQALMPKGGEDAVTQQRVFDAATKKAEAVLKARADDPALAVQQLPELKASAPEVDWSQPESVQGYLSQVEAAQVMLNTERALLPKSQAAQLGQQIRNVLRMSPAPDEAAKNFLAAMEPVYGRFTDDVFMQAYETLLDKDLSKDTRTLVSDLVMQWARETPGMQGWRHNTADDLMATDLQPALDETAKAEERGTLGRMMDWVTNAPPPAPPPPPAPELPPAPRARPITVDGVPAEAVDAYMQNAGNPKIQSMFRRTYGGDALKTMQDQLKERGMFGASN
jgi:GH24 family phage-related lysozyme (muramidase)